MIILETVPEPKVGRLDIARLSIDVRISAEQAREKVGEWLFDEITMMMEAERPTFIVGEPSVWRVPVIFYANNAGRLGQIGTIDVDANTGDIVPTVEEAQDKLYPPAQRMAEKLPPLKIHTPPDQYKSKRLPPAKVLNYSEML